MSDFAIGIGGKDKNIVFITFPTGDTYNPVLYSREFPSEKDARISAMDLKHRASRCLPGKLITLLESWSNGQCIQGTNATKCPNCGAPIENNRDCVYCGQML